MTPAYADLLARVRARPPLLTMVLGSGLSALAERLDLWASVSYLETPGLEEATGVAGHQGRLLFGAWAGKTVLIFSGRLHFYEGHPWRKVLQQIHLAHELGARTMLLTNAAGGIRDDLGPGSLMALKDHRDWTRPDWWRRPLPAEQANPYSPRLLALLRQAARDCEVALAEGVYAQVTGPSYETPAEIRAFRAWGAEAVGMSTAREIMAAHELGMECAALSCITNRAAGLSPTPLDHHEVLATAAQQRLRMGALLEGFLILL